MMLTTGLCLLLIATPDVTLTQAKSTATSFRITASKGGTENFIGPEPLTDEPEVNETSFPGSYDLNYGDGHVVVRKSDGVIFKFWFSDNSALDEQWNESGKLTNSQLQTLCQHYRNAAGMTGTVTLDSAEENRDVDPMVFDVRVSPKFNGVGVHNSHASYFEISHTTGRLMAMELYDVPTPPASVVPSVSSETARSTALSYVYSSKGVGTFADLEPAKLSIWKPVSEIPPGTDNFLTSAHAAMAASNQSLLIHEFYVEGRDTLHGKGGVYSPRYWAAVDAQTGDLLVVYEYKPFGGGGTAISFPPSPALGPGPLSIFDVAKKKEVKLRTSNLESSLGKTPMNARSIVLGRGRLRIMAKIDPKSGLVWTRTAKAKLDGASLKAYRASIGWKG